MLIFLILVDEMKKTLIALCDILQEWWRSDMVWV